MHFADQSWAGQTFAVRSWRTRDCQVLAFGAGEGAAPAHRLTNPSPAAPAGTAALPVLRPEHRTLPRRAGPGTPPQLRATSPAALL